MNNTQQQTAFNALVASGFYKPAHKGASDLQNEYRVGRHDLIVTVDFDFDDMVVSAECEEWQFSRQNRYNAVENILSFVEVAQDDLNELIDAD